MKKMIASILLVCTLVISLSMIFLHREDTEIDVLLANGADASEIEEILKETAGVSKVAYFSKDAELDYYLNTLSDSAREEVELLVSSTGNPMSDRMAITVRGNADQSALLESISAIDGVSEVLGY